MTEGGAWLPQAYPLYVAYWESEIWGLLRKRNKGEAFLPELYALSKASNEDIMRGVSGPYLIVGWFCREAMVPVPYQAEGGIDLGMHYIDVNPDEAVRKAYEAGQAERATAVEQLGIINGSG